MTLYYFGGNAGWQRRGAVSVKLQRSHYSKKTADMETFLDHKIIAVYQLNATDDFINAVGDTIFTFTCSFRDSFKGESAFIMTAQDAQLKQGAVFMLIEQEMKFEMLGLSQAQTIDDENSDEEEEDSDELDFSMM